MNVTKADTAVAAALVAAPVSQTLRLNQTASLAGVVAPAASFVEKINPPVSQAEITLQSPIVGAELNLRTLTIAERLAPSPSQEAMFYAIGNRIAILQLLADLEITIDDIPIIVELRAVRSQSAVGARSAIGGHRGTDTAGSRTYSERGYRRQPG